MLCLCFILPYLGGRFCFFVCVNLGTFVVESLLQHIVFVIVCVNLGTIPGCIYSEGDMAVPDCVKIGTFN